MTISHLAPEAVAFSPELNAGDGRPTAPADGLRERPQRDVMPMLRGLRLRVWEGAGLLTDFRPDAERPQFMTSGLHALSGFEVPFLPEPYEDEGHRNAVVDGHFERFLRDMVRMVYGLHLPEVYHGRIWERLQAFPTFDLRLVSTPEAKGPGRIRLFLLAKVFVPVEGADVAAEARALACEKIVAACRLYRAVAPPVLPLKPLDWVGASASKPNSPQQSVAVRDEDLGLAPAFPFIGELRRENFLTGPEPEGKYEAFCSNLRGGGSKQGQPRVFAVPTLWPTSTHDLLPTCSVIAGSSTPVVLSVRLHPTMRTRQEHRALLRRQQEIREAKEGQSKVLLMRSERLISDQTAHQELFHIAVQVAGTDAGSVNEVLATLASEQAVRRGLSEPPGMHSRPSRLMCLHRSELEVASFNLRHVELWPWGAVDDKARESCMPAGSYISGAPDLNGFPPPEELRAPEVFQRRDLEDDPNLVRHRMLVSLQEAASAWRLPIVGVGGQAGLASRLPNPFEQLPRETPTGPRTISLGLVQHRGVSTLQDYRVPLLGQQGAYTGIGDRVIVVAGSPGSGKTNFCLHFLEQLWDRAENGHRYPYLVIDPTRGLEFRWLFSAAPDDLVIFTVGDAREVPFCFNPLIVPRNVGLQGHISRLMSCFRAAYYMWDPLPAIFEEAIRLSYRRKFESLGRRWDPTATFGTGRVDDYPTLSDVCATMGTGAANERDTVLARQRELWSAGGQATDNQATIIASTSLRLLNLRDNFDHIIGGPAPGRPCLDLTKLLKVPAVLELGMIGDSQALSLIMAFLVVSLAGCIENRNRDEDLMHVLVIEEAHRLLSAEGGSSQDGSSSRAQAAEDINNLLAEVRKYGQGVMLLDQRPGSLVGGVIDNAYLVALHRLNERKSFEQFADMLNLNPNQRRFARFGLQPGEAIFLDHPTGIPVALRPPEKPKEQARKERSDDLLRRLRERAGKLNYEAPPARAAEDGRAALLLDRCGSVAELRETLEKLRAHLKGGAPKARVVLRYAKDLARGLGVEREALYETARDLFLHLASEAGLTAEVTDEIRKEVDDG